MSPTDLNLVIPQGTTFTKTVVLRHGLRLARDLRSNIQTPPTSITIVPLPIDLPSGYKLSFPLSGCNFVDLVTTAITPIGSDTVPIQPYTGKANLACNSTANTLPINLTGETWRGACRKTYEDATPLFNWSFIVDPLIGRIVGTVSATATTAIALTKKERIIYSDIPKDYQLEKNFRPEIWAKAWFYDWERVLPDGRIDRVFEGRLWMTSEATR